MVVGMPRPPLIKVGFPDKAVEVHLAGVKPVESRLGSRFELLHGENQVGRTLNELCEHLDMTRQGVTQHLGVLEAANLVVTVWRGREKLHFLNPVPLQEIYERWIAKFEKPRLKALADLKRRLEESNG